MLSKNSAISIGVLLGDGNDYIYICEFTVNVLEICNHHHLCARAQIVRLKSWFCNQSWRHWQETQKTFPSSTEGFRFIATGNTEGLLLFDVWSCRYSVEGSSHTRSRWRRRHYYKNITKLPQFLFSNPVWDSLFTYQIITKKKVNSIHSSIWLNQSLSTATVSRNHEIQTPSTILTTRQ